MIHILWPIEHIDDGKKKSPCVSLKLPKNAKPEKYGDEKKEWFAGDEIAIACETGFEPATFCTVVIRAIH